MLVYRDMTFCSRKECKNVKCRRHWHNVQEYWDNIDNEEEFVLPVSVSEFSECKYYVCESGGCENDR